MKSWRVEYNKFDPEEENLREALCTLGNGYFGTRGAAPETAASRVHYPGTYIAGVYNTLSTEVAGRTVNNEDFVNCPNWLMFNYRIENGNWFNRLQVKILSWRKELDIKNGILYRFLKWQDDKGRKTTVKNERIVSMARPHCGGIRCELTPENYDGKLTVRVGIDGLILNEGVDRYKQLNNSHLDPCAHGSFHSDGVYLQMKTTQSEIQISEAQRVLVYLNGKKISPKLKFIAHGRQRVMHEFQVKLKRGDKLIVEKLVSIYTSRDQGVADNCERAQEAALSIKNFDYLLLPHKAKWAALWNRFDIEVKGDLFVQMAVRFHTFHLLQAASTYNAEIDAGLTARGLHGEAYRGHVFWDEMYVYPFYNLHAPEITRSLLMYRYRRLGAAKDNARQQGYRGAMYPWQTASKGDEQTQEIHLNPMSGKWGPDYSSLQRHVSIAIAYNVWNYYYMTSDRDFLNRYGAEMILEIAHFWSSAAEWNKKTKRYEIKGVMGPDEFHEKYPAAKEGGVKNNAYTNVMAVWVMDRAVQILDEMMISEERKALLSKTEISDDEIKRWRDISQKMTVPMDKNGLIHQFEGYMDLTELDWEEYRNKYTNIHRIDRILKSEGLSPDSFKVAKQADTVMLFYVLNFHELKAIFKKLGYPFTRASMKKNFNYYYQRTSHGSTLSMVVHAYVANIIGNRDLSMDAFLYALRSDLYDTQGGTTQEGIHSGVMGSSIDLLLRCFAGLEILEDKISINPILPEKWKSLRFQVRYKNIWFHIRLDSQKMKIIVEFVEELAMMSSVEVPVRVKNKTYRLTPGKPTVIKY